MKNYFTFFCLALTFISCDPPECHNTNPIFDTNPTESKVYQDELVKHLKAAGNSELIYTFESYVEKDRDTLLYVHVQNDSLCAWAAVKVVNSNGKIENLLKNKGKGYNGAILKNLQLQIVQDSLKTEVIYKDVDAIID